VSGRLGSANTLGELGESYSLEKKAALGVEGITGGLLKGDAGALNDDASNTFSLEAKKVFFLKKRRKNFVCLALLTCIVGGTKDVGFGVVSATPMTMRLLHFNTPQF